MNKVFLSLLVMISPLYVEAQNGLTTSDISDFVYSFDIQNDSIVGEGANILINSINNSQFLLLGEQHYSRQISQLTNILLPYLARMNYKYFAIETGPHSSEKLTYEIKTNSSLYKFNSYFIERYKWKPIPFFDGKEDEIFLKTALDHGFEIWGLDQEYVSSQLFLIDDIYDLQPDKQIVSSEYCSSKKYLEQEFAKINDWNYPLFKNLINSPILKSFFQKCTLPEQQEIIDDLLFSWKIYSLGGYENNLMRMCYMKKNFSNNYKAAIREDQLPKVFFKLGSMHLGYGKNWLDIYDLGNLVFELAQFNGENSVAVNCFSRYTLEDNGKIEDITLAEDGNTYFPLIDFAQKDNWILIDNAPIREIIFNRDIEINNDLKVLIFNFDFVLFTPTRTPMSPNW